MLVWKNHFCTQVSFSLRPEDNLGLMIRGGIEYGLGIFITGVDQTSVASKNGIKVSDSPR